MFLACGSGINYVKLQHFFRMQQGTMSQFIPQIRNGLTTD